MAERDEWPVMPRVKSVPDLIAMVALYEAYVAAFQVRKGRTPTSPLHRRKRRRATPDR